MGPLLTVSPIFLQCPNSNGDESDPCPLCGYTSTTTRNNKARRDDEDSCPYIAPPADAWCTDSGAVQRRDAHIDKRVIPTPKEWSFNGQTLYWMAYPQCSVSDQGGVKRWYTYSDDQKTCSAEVSKVNKDPNKDTVRGVLIKGNFATDHVFEVQFVSRFLNWLAGIRQSNALPMRPGWTAASPAWVSEQLGIGGKGRVTLQNPPSGGDSGDFIDVVRQNYVGNINNPDPLAIVLGAINSVKQNWMAGDVVPFRDTTPSATARNIKAVSG